MRLIPSLIDRPLSTIAAAAKNAVEVARLGGLNTGELPAAYEVASRQRIYNLRHYVPEVCESDCPPLLLVPPLMLTAEVYDVSPRASAVRVLQAAGVDPWVIDFGSPEREEGGLQRTLADHVLAVSSAVDQVRAATGRDVHLAGYSQGGMFCYQAAAYRRSSGIASLITFGSPVDLRGALPMGLPEEIAIPGASFVVDKILGGRAIPGWVTRNSFSMLDPVNAVRQRIDFILQLYDREALLPREGQRKFLMGGGWVAWPGPALAEFVRQFLVHNRMLQGGFTIGDRLVTLADIACPILYFVGESDDIAPARAVRAIDRAAPRSALYEVRLPSGHFGLVVGRQASERTWPIVSVWTHWVQGSLAELPDTVTHIEPGGAAGSETAHGAFGAAALQAGAQLAVDTAVGAVRAVGDSAGRTVRFARSVTEQAAVQLPRLARIGRAGTETRLSLALLLDERARRAPEDVLFLFGDRAVTNLAVKHRIDSIVRGLISIGVHQGEHVAVLMGTRPSALALVAALNRLGAVAVLVRAGSDVARQVALGQATRVVTDAEHADMARAATELPILLFGGGGGPRDTGGLVDLERVDIDKVRLPTWYEPNMGRAGDLAFVLFTGDVGSPRPIRITNRRWALSAFGTASAGALSRSDTVLSINPLSHPSGLLTSVGGAVAGHSRLALATGLDPETFWDEVRRYGVTVVSYAWAQLHDLVEAPPHPGERHHSIRLIAGSGMPPGLWRRVEQRFAPARVLEFWAATEGEAVLANVRGSKRGSLGRPLPDGAELRIARYDAETRQLVQNRGGLAIACRDDEVGLLLAKTEHSQSTIAPPLRSVFARGDAWLSTDTLFVRDGDGDYWLVDSPSTLLRRDGVDLASMPIVRALSELDAVDLVVTYGAAGPRGARMVAAVSLRPGCQLAPADVERALSVLPGAEQPDVVRTVAEVPLSSWHRPVVGPLRTEGLGRHSRRLPAWYREASTGRYRKLDAAAAGRLLGS